MGRQLKRELTLHARDARPLVHSCLFFIMILVFFPLAISADLTQLRAIAPGIIWIDLLFSFFLSTERLFQHDYDEGIIEQWITSGCSLIPMILAKMIVHWSLVLLPMLLLCPLIGLFYHLNSIEQLTLVLSLISGSPAIILLCALAAAFSTGIKQKGMLMSLILFPLAIPLLIFGSGTLNAMMMGLPSTGQLMLLLAISILALLFIPFSIAMVVRVNLAD